MGNSTFQYGPKVVTDGLILYLDAANPKSYPGSGTDWIDLSRLNNNNGTLINGPTFDSANGGNIVFDGIDDYVDTTNPSNLSPSSSFSLSVWGNGIGYVLNSFVADSSFNFSGVIFNITYGGISEFSFSDGTAASYNLNVSGPPPLSGIYYVATYDGSNDANGMKLYMDGIEQATTINSNTPLTQSPPYNIPWVIGTAFQDVPPLTPIVFYTGGVFIAQVYNKVLTQSEITQNYNAFKGRFNL